MTINLALASIKASGGTTSRTFANRFSEVINVKDYGALGDNSTDDTTAIQAAFNAAFGSSASPHATVNSTLNKIVYFPEGTYITSSPLTLTRVHGGRIFGAGSTVSVIRNISSNIINTNGFEFCRIESMGFSCTVGGGGRSCINLDWDNTSGAALQGNCFSDCFFSGGADYGVLIGASDNMGSENLFFNCHFTQCTKAAIRTSNLNALDQIVIGGGMSECDVGVWNVQGSFAAIINVAFGGNTSYDIKYETNSIIFVMGCRTETPNFIYAPAGTWHISSCAQDIITSGTFISGLNGVACIDNCQSAAGDIRGLNGTLWLRANNFTRSDWIDNWFGTMASESLQDVRESRTTGKDLSRGWSGTSYDNYGATGEVDINLPYLDDAGGSSLGVKFSFYVSAAQTFKIIARNGIKIRIANSISAANGNIAANTVGNYVELESCKDGSTTAVWVAKSVVGTWTVT